MSIPFVLKFSLYRIFPTGTIKDEKNVFQAKRAWGSSVNTHYLLILEYHSTYDIGTCLIYSVFLIT